MKFARRSLFFFVSVCLSLTATAAPVVEGNGLSIPNGAIASDGLPVDFNEIERRQARRPAAPARPAARPAAAPARAPARPAAPAARPPAGAARPAAAPARAAACAAPRAAAGGRNRVRSFFGLRELHTFTARAFTEARTGATVVVNGVSFRLGTQRSGRSRGSGTTATFDTTFNGIACVAKQQTTASNAVFAKEIADTDKAGTAQGNGLLVASGCDAQGGMWMIVRKMPGQDLLTRWISRRTPLATCRTELATAISLASTAQQTMAARGGIIQGDDNFENYLFNDAMTAVNVIDFGIARAVNPASAAQIKTSQAREMTDVTLGPLIEFAQGSGACR